MIVLKRTNSSDTAFVSLVKKLDVYLAEKDGEEHDFYDQYNKLNDIKYCIVAYVDEVPAGCGAIKEFEDAVMEVKRMYTSPEHRNLGIAAKVLTELEYWARELGFEKTILETGKRQTEAIGFYKKNNYVLRKNYGQYARVENSICFEKKLSGL